MASDAEAPDFSPWSFNLLGMVLRECMPRVTRIEMVVTHGDQSARTVIDLDRGGPVSETPPAESD